MTPEEIKALKVGQRVQVWAEFAHFDGLCVKVEARGVKFWLSIEDIISAEPLPIEVGDAVDWLSNSGCQVMAIADDYALIRAPNDTVIAARISDLTLIKKASDHADD